MKISKERLREIISEELAETKAAHSFGSNYERQKMINERRMLTNVFKIVMQALNRQGPMTHQQLLANVLHQFPNVSDEQIDGYIDMLEDEGQIIFNRTTQKYE